MSYDVTTFAAQAVGTLASLGFGALYYYYDESKIPGRKEQLYETSFREAKRIWPDVVENSDLTPAAKADTLFARLVANHSSEVQYIFNQVYSWQFGWEKFPLRANIRGLETLYIQKSYPKYEEDQFFVEAYEILQPYRTEAHDMPILTGTLAERATQARERVLPVLQLCLSFIDDVKDTDAPWGDVPVCMLKPIENLEDVDKWLALIVVPLYESYRADKQNPWNETPPELEGSTIFEKAAQARTWLLAHRDAEYEKIQREKNHIQEPSEGTSVLTDALLRLQMQQMVENAK